MNLSASGDRAGSGAGPDAARPTGSALPGAASPAAPEVDDLSPPEPLPNDGVASVAVGTALWAVAALVMLFFLDDLRGDGRLWWLATAICGFVLGLAGLWIVVRRRNRLRSAQPS
jgi:hypothetical protein